MFDSNVSPHPRGRKGIAPRDGIVDGSSDGGQDGRMSGSTSARRTILRGTTFNVPQGARPWPLGTSGSTLLTLLYRFYSPDSGSIRLGGNDIFAYTTRFVRRAMAVVPQDVVLLSTARIRHRRRRARPEAERGGEAARVTRSCQRRADVEPRLSHRVGDHEQSKGGRTGHHMHHHCSSPEHNPGLRHHRRHGRGQSR